MLFETIVYEEKQGIGYITINRPKALNALNRQALEELSKVLEMVEANDTVKVVIITGSGGKAFVAGADISAMKNMTATEAYEYARLGQMTFNKIYRLSKIVIAAIDGFALGGGCELALACDIRIASKKSQMGIPETSLGVIPGFAGTQRLSRVVGAATAKEMLSTARKVNADEAKEMGLVNYIVEENPLEKAEELSAEICKNSINAIRLGKKAINEGLEMELSKGIEHEAALFAMAFTMVDQKEGMSAFLEKRQANFK